MENVLGYLRMVSLNRLIRVKEEVNKDAILAEPETVANIKGISITQRGIHRDPVRNGLGIGLLNANRLLTEGGLPAVV